MWGFYDQVIRNIDAKLNDFRVSMSVQEMRDLRRLRRNVELARNALKDERPLMEEGLIYGCVW